MSNIINQREELISYIKTIILKYCPYTDNRLSILGNSKSPELDIELDICNDKSHLMFIFGNHNYKASIPEKVETSHIISFEELCDVIDYLLKDHEMIKELNYDYKRIDLKFAINWTDQSIKGINCGDISLNLNFENMEVKKQYLYLLFQRYYKALEHTSSFTSLKNRYITSMKHSYFDNLDKNEIISFLNRMKENDLKELLYNINNDMFMKYIVDEEQPKAKILLLKDN